MKKRRPLFHAGDTVRVRSRDEINRFLGDRLKTDGCLFMPVMWKFCGHSFSVSKVVINFYDEYRAQMCRVKGPFYILDGVICDGDMGDSTTRCDRSCHHIWHENWLERCS